MHKGRIPQERSDVKDFRLRLASELIKEQVLGEGDPEDEIECILRYEAWKSYDSDYIKSIKKVAIETTRRRVKTADKRPLRVILQDMMLSDRHNYESAIRNLTSRYLAKLIMEVQEKEDELVLSRFLEFLEKYL